MEPVLDAPVSAHGTGEQLGVEGERGQEVAPLDRSRVAASDRCPDHGDGLEAGEARRAGIAAIRGEPSDVVADDMAADLAAAVAEIDGLVAVEAGLPGVCEEQAHVLGEHGPVVFEREEIVGALVEDGLGDGGLRAHGVDRHQGAGQLQPLQQQRDRHDLVGLLTHGLLAQHQALARRPGRDDMERMAALGAGATRTLAIDRDDVGLGLAQGLDPGGKARREQAWIEGVQNVVEGVVRRDAMSERKHVAQEFWLVSAPTSDLE
ncbi:hypothetical protein MPEAHAMD_7254 [Methylobacterium frigidaeris]|uniref:Uncharacterized protein n=1 Tax=Methylobacterium frigidaeris TaxID=2038277 RepID=A0AA37HKX8_9HYPH|nr:hypothetical protein MPEAHAMD_7254 [Methylobacterium frigidaeris]